MRLLLLALALATSAAAQAPTGSLSGTITDDAGETLPGALVFIPEVQRGAATDIDGAYTIAGIPVGVYEVQFSSVGYGTQVVYDVVVSEDRALRFNMALALSSSDLIGCPVIVYERPLISPNAAVPTIIEGDALENRPDRYTNGHGFALTSVYSR